jgi:hypothetical protein
MRLIIDGNRASVPLAVIQLKYRPDGGYDGLGPVHPPFYGFPVEAPVEASLKPECFDF